MRDNPTAVGHERFALRSQLAELSRVFPWVEALAARYEIPEKTQFAINLCLEEALSNIVRHGYIGDADQLMVVEFQRQDTEFVFTISDLAPHFHPSDSPASQPASLEEMTAGGLGIPLMRQFADRVEWKPLDNGNCLTLAFLRPS